MTAEAMTTMIMMNNYNNPSKTTTKEMDATADNSDETNQEI